jgi:hypothetical protein
MKLALQNRAKALTSGSSQAEVINVTGPLQTAERLEQQQLIENTSADK